MEERRNFWSAPEGGPNMPIKYKIDVIAALKEAGYNTTRIRKEKIMGEAMLQKIRSHVLPRARDCLTDRPDKFPPGLSLHGKASSFHLILYMPDSRQSPVGFFSD